MSFREQLQHLGVLIDTDTGEPVGAQRSDRDRAGIVRIVLLRLARPQQSSACRQHRWDVHDGLARSDELLSEEIAEPACGLDRPHPIGERCRPRPQSIGLAQARTRNSSSTHSVLSIATAVCDALCGSMPMMMVICKCLPLGDGNRGGHS